ncbi:hypothetical protein [Evansella tamaricis]|uniref:DUF3139 domain-containing protein n=1 Tax=Evansella tamaricis TaxID=2069301 RepID=A0ABS6JGS1_9BACI|nr:hypothetical protein [Evansella tamaricis]MBU9712843.1 hypothetical protein [Evansella tamaricis]
MKIIISVAFIMLVAILGTSLAYLVGTTESEEYRYAETHAIEYVMGEYDITMESVSVDSIQYWEEEDRYAIRVNGADEGEMYEIALRLDDENDIAFLLDVTGQFDQYGLAYCH